MNQFNSLTNEQNTEALKADIKLDMHRFCRLELIGIGPSIQLEKFDVVSTTLGTGEAATESSSGQSLAMRSQIMVNGIPKAVSKKFEGIPESDIFALENAWLED